jgi:hypothetical protein
VGSSSVKLTFAYSEVTRAAEEAAVEIFVQESPRRALAEFQYSSVSAVCLVGRGALVTEPKPAIGCRAGPPLLNRRKNKVRLER